MSFALLNLPYVPRKHILKFMSFSDLIKFAKISKRMKSAVKSLRHGFTFFRLFFSPEGLLHLAFIPYDKAVLTCFVPSLPGSPEQEIPGDSFQINYKEPTRESRLEVFEQFLTECLELFLVKSIIVTFIESFDYENCFVWKFARYIIIMDIWHIHNKSPEISSKTLLFGLENPLVKGLTVRGRVETGFKYSKGLTTNLACHNVAKWLNFEAVLNMECNFFQLEVTDHFSSQQLNTFIKKWISGDGLQLLKNFQMKTRRSKEREEVNEMLCEVLEGVRTEKWDVKLRDTHYNGLCENFSNGAYIWRNNGQRAAVFIRKGSIQFYTRLPNPSFSH